jgi:hypothetical protein
MPAIPNSNIRQYINGKWYDRVTIGMPDGESVPVDFVVSDSTPDIKNITLVSANVEQSVTLETGLRQIMIRNRSPQNAVLKIAFTSGESGTKFITIPKGNSFNLENINFNSKTLYLQSNQDNTIVEILQIS